MTTYEPRAAWTSTAARGDWLSPDRLEGFALHYPASGNVTIGTGRPGIVRRLQGYRYHHVYRRGWVDIGYQVAVDQAGRVWGLRGIDRVPAAAASSANPDANRKWGAVLCLLGNDEQPSEAMVAAIRDWRETRWLVRYPRATAITGHGRVPGASTACPGVPVLELIDSGLLTADRPDPSKRVIVSASHVRDVARAGLAGKQEWPSAQVKAVQAALNDALRNILGRPLVVDGWWGPRTTEVHLVYEKWRGFDKVKDGLPDYWSVRRLGDETGRFTTWR